MLGTEQLNARYYWRTEWIRRLSRMFYKEQTEYKTEIQIRLFLQDKIQNLTKTNKNFGFAKKKLQNLAKTNNNFGFVIFCISLLYRFLAISVFWWFFLWTGYDPKTRTLTPCQTLTPGKGFLPLYNGTYSFLVSNYFACIYWMLSTEQLNARYNWMTDWMKRLSWMLAFRFTKQLNAWLWALHNL